MSNYQGVIYESIYLTARNVDSIPLIKRNRYT